MHFFGLVLVFFIAMGVIVLWIFLRTVHQLRVVVNEGLGDRYRFLIEL